MNADEIRAWARARYPGNRGAQKPFEVLARHCESQPDRLSPAARRLVVAARLVALGDQSAEALKELDAASEAFAGQVPWDDEPEDVSEERLIRELRAWPLLVDGDREAIGKALFQRIDACAQGVRLDAVSDALVAMLALSIRQRVRAIEGAEAIADALVKDVHAHLRANWDEAERKWR